MGCTFIIIFLRLLTALGFGKSTVSTSCLSNTYVSTSHVSVHCPSVCVLFLGITEKFYPVLRAVLKTWSRYTALIVSFVLHLFQSLLLTAWQPVTCIGLGTGVLADALIAFSMCWYLYRKRTGFSRHVHFLLRLYSKFVNFVFRTDSMIMTLMSYSINSGLLTW